jgi:hypothetical protein
MKDELACRLGTVLVSMPSCWHCADLKVCTGLTNVSAKILLSAILRSNESLHRCSAMKLGSRRTKLSVTKMVRDIVICGSKVDATFVTVS